nr:DUF1016 N-terminal domain-containing protein [Curtobacterium sp. MCSS17_008]
MRNARFTAQRRVNTKLVRLYWGIGSTILQRQEQEGWEPTSSDGSPKISARSSRR